MCLLLVARDVHPEYPFIFAGNRDEFYERPAAEAVYWDEYPQLLAGKDLSAGGTWLGVTREGKFAVITNVREGRNENTSKRSRGDIVKDYLVSPVQKSEFLGKLQETGEQYNGFNVLFGSLSGGLFYYSNRTNSYEKPGRGVRGLSNASLDSPWYKVRKAKNSFHQLLRNGELSEEHLFEILADRQKAPDDELPSTGIPYAWEKMLSSIFIHSEGYGTRCSTVIMLNHRGEVTFSEISFNKDGNECGRVGYRFTIYSESSDS